MHTASTGDGKAGGQNKPGLSLFSGLLPVLLLFALIIGLWLFPPSVVVFEPNFLLPVFNTTLFLAAAVIACIALRSYLITGVSTILWLGCGVWTLGLGALAAGWLIYPFGPNVNVTIFNVGAFLAAICHAGAVLTSLEEQGGGVDPHRRKWQAWSGYLAAAAAIALLIFLTLTGIMPPFFIQGKGPTVLRQYVVEWAIVLYTFAALVLMQRYLRKRTPFLYWYSLALALVALSLLAFFLQPAVGSLIGWAGRSSYVLAAVYFLLSVNSAWRAASTRGVGLSEALAELFGPGLLWQGIMATVSDAVVAYNEPGEILFWNKAAEKIFGYQEAEVAGKGIGLILPDPKFLEASGHTGGITEIEPLLRDGSRFNAEISASQTKSSLGVITTLVIRDVTARKRAEEALRESEARLDLALRSSEMGVWYLDLVENKRFFDDQVCHLLGLDPVEFTGKAEEFFNAVHPQDRDVVKSALARTIEHDVLYQPEFRTIWPDGSIHYLTSRGKLINDHEGRAIRLNGLIWDITERKRGEEALHRLNEELEQRVEARTEELEETVAQLEEAMGDRQQAELELAKLNAELEQRVKERTAELEFTNRELEAFTYSVSHDLKAPIRAIQGFSQMLLREHLGSLDEEGLRLFQVIIGNTQIMSRLIDDLLSLSRLGRHQIRKSSIDLAAMVRQVFAQLQEQEPERDLKLTVPDHLPPAWGDPSLIHQVMMNLLGNAIKYTRAKQTANLEVGGSSQGQGTVYYVKDNGIGFDELYAHKLFGVFQRLHGGPEYEGTGVGLAIVQRIIHRHGGRVWAEGKVGEGATFYFSLPK